MNYKHLAITTSLLSSLLLVGCGDTDSGVPLAVQPPIGIAAPTAGNIAFSVLGSSSTTATAANGILSVGNPNTATVVKVQSPTTRGGTITANADGSFTYNAPALGNTTDTFSYTIQNAGGSATGTATVTLLGRGFFVNNQAAPGGTGTQAQPFQTLAQVQAAATGVNGAEIVVFQGDGTNNGYNTPISLSANQTLRGFSQAATPLLTGPVSLATGNRLEDVRISGTPGAASAVNATAASNGIINRLSISNCTSAGNLTGAAGTFSISNLDVQNMTSQGLVTASSSGNLSWSVNNSTFTNTAICAVCTAPTATAVQNLTVTNCSITGGGSAKILLTPNTTGTNVGLTVTNCTVNGANTALTGIDIDVRGSTAFTGLLTNNNITACTDAGILAIAPVGNPTVRLKLSGNRTLGNALNRGIGLGCANNANLCAVVQNNISDAFVFNQNAPSVLGVELLASFAARNTGTLQTVGNITDLINGACGLP